MHNVIIVLTAAMVAWGLWRTGQPKPVFNILVSGGIPRTTYGTVTPAFLQRVREVVAAHAIKDGMVSGHARGPLIRLRFSPGFAEPARQQLRNWWASFGWAAPSASLPSRCS